MDQKTIQEEGYGENEEKQNEQVVGNDQEKLSCVHLEETVVQNDRIQNEVEAKQKAFRRARCATEHNRLLLLNKQYDELRALMGINPKVTKLATLKNAILYIKTLVYMQNTQLEDAAPVHDRFQAFALSLEDSETLKATSTLSMKHLHRRYPVVKRILSIAPAPSNISEKSSIPPKNQPNVDAQLNMHNSIRQRAISVLASSDSSRMHTSACNTTASAVGSHLQPFGKHIVKEELTDPARAPSMIKSKYPVCNAEVGPYNTVAMETGSEFHPFENYQIVKEERSDVRAYIESPVLDEVVTANSAIDADTEHQFIANVGHIPMEEDTEPLQFSPRSLADMYDLTNGLLPLEALDQIMLGTEEEPI